MLAAILAIGSNLAAAMAAGGAQIKVLGVTKSESPLAKYWTTRGQEHAAGSQVLAIPSLTSHSSFEAEGTGLEPATRFPRHHISSVAANHSLTLLTIL